jgi:hypothetical protein
MDERSTGHVRALEDRMNDIERWFVDNEKESGEPAGSSVTGIQAPCLNTRSAQAVAGELFLSLPFVQTTDTNHN